MDFNKLLLMLLMFILYSPVHEFGHWIVANADNAEILGVELFPHIKGDMIAMGCTVVNEYSFSSLSTLVLFKIAGFLITFIPAVLFFVYLRRRDSKLWDLPFIWIILAPAASGNDYLDIGRVTGKIILGKGLYAIGYFVTFIFLCWFLAQIFLVKGNNSVALRNRR